MPLATTRADRPASERALTSAPASSNSCILPRSGAAHISAVAPAVSLASGSAPSARRRFTSAASPLTAADISGVAASVPTLADGLRRVAQHAVDCRLVALTNGAHQQPTASGSAAGVGDLPGQLVGPFRALIDPLLDGLDLPRLSAGPGRRHPLPELGVDQPVIEPASVGVTRPDVRLRPAAQGVGAAIEPQPVHLQFGAVDSSHSAAAGSAARHVRNRSCLPVVAPPARPPSPKPLQ